MAVAAVVLIGSLGVLFGKGVARSPEITASPPESLPQEVVGSRRVRLADYPDRPWLSYFRANRDWLGEPVWGERPEGIYAACVGFERYIVCRNPDPKTWGTIWAFLPLLLGEQALPAGTSPQLDAPLAPIVQSYISTLDRQGQDWNYWLGRPISPAYCPATGGECVQVLQRQVLRWPAGSADPASVRLTNLGVSTSR